MKPLLPNWTVVLAGRWNLEILNPEWVTQKIFERENVEIDLVLNGMQANLRYRFDDLAFIPRHNNVLFNVNNTSDESLAAIESAACKLLSALPVTPMTALGINFTFIEDDTPINVARIFNISDTAQLADKGLQIKSTRVRREIVFEDRQLNLIFTQLEGGKTRVALNFHHDVETPDEAHRMLKDQVVRLRHAGEDLLNSVYGLSVEDEENE